MPFEGQLGGLDKQLTGIPCWGHYETHAAVSKLPKDVKKPSVLCLNITFEWWSRITPHSTWIKNSECVSRISSHQSISKYADKCTYKKCKEYKADYICAFSLVVGNDGIRILLIDKGSFEALWVHSFLAQFVHRFYLL